MSKSAKMIDSVCNCASEDFADYIPLGKDNYGDWFFDWPEIIKSVAQKSITRDFISQCGFSYEEATRGLRHSQFHS